METILLSVQNLRLHVSRVNKRDSLWSVKYTGKSKPLITSCSVFLKTFVDDESPVKLGSISNCHHLKFKELNSLTPRPTYLP